MFPVVWGDTPPTSASQYSVLKKLASNMSGVSLAKLRTHCWHFHVSGWGYLSNLLREYCSKSWHQQRTATNDNCRTHVCSSMFISLNIKNRCCWLVDPTTPRTKSLWFSMLAKDVAHSGPILVELWNPSAQCLHFHLCLFGRWLLGCDLSHCGWALKNTMLHSPMPSLGIWLWVKSRVPIGTLEILE